MSYNGEYVIIDEDFDIEDDETLLDEGIIDKVKEIVTNTKERATSTLQFITSANNIDEEKSKKSVDLAIKKQRKLINTGKYREVNSSDKTAITNTIKSKEFLNFLFGDIHFTTGLKYSIFKYKGLTILTLNAPMSKEKRSAGGRNSTIFKKLGNGRLAYTILVKSKNNKIIFNEITLYPKLVGAKDRVNYDL